MRRLFYLAVCFVVLLSAAFAGEVIDGVVASVNRHPILRSDWDEAVRFEAFMQQKPLTEITEGERLLGLKRLIDRQLLIAQMGDAKYLEPSQDRLAQDLAKLRAQLPNGADDAAWRRLLAGYGLNEQSVVRHLRNEFRVMNFIEVRLRPNVHISDEEVEAYYRDQLIPDLRKSGAAIVPLNDVKSRIQELLTQKDIDELLDTWLHNLRQQAEIRSTVAVPGVNAPEGDAGAAGAN